MKRACFLLLTFVIAVAATGQVKRYVGNYALYPTDSPQSVSVTISGHNKIPAIYPADNFTPGGSEVVDFANCITGWRSLGGGVLQVDYKTIPDARRAHIMAIDLYSNMICADVPCEPGEGSVGLHISNGVYALCLYGDNIPMYNIRVIVSH